MESVDTLTDEAIVELVCRDNQEHYAQLVTRYQQPLLRYVYNLIHNEAVAQDVVQETFIKAFVNLNGFDARKKFSSWIYRIAHNEAMNAVKKYRKEVRLPETFEIPSELNLEDVFSRQETVDRVQQCLSALPIRYAEPLLLRYVDEQSYDEISYILRIPQNTVSSRISRGKKLLHRICQRH